jgi:Ricin-type beta-trefoil lectin domain-like
MDPIKCITAVLFALTLAGCCAATSNMTSAFNQSTVVFAVNSCITIMDGNSVMYERTEKQSWTTYVYMINKDQEYDNQRWILEQTVHGYFKLKNKHSNRYLAIDDFNYFKTDNVAIKNMHHYKFDRQNDGKYEIYNKDGKRLRSYGHGWCMVTSKSAHYFTVKQCEQTSKSKKKN